VCAVVGYKTVVSTAVEFGRKSYIYFISRVRLTVAKRDETTQKLKSQYESALERCSYLEDLLEQQRRDFILK
jgi:hypothetical protein